MDSVSVLQSQPTAPFDTAVAPARGDDVAKRRLTVSEMSRVREWALARERHEYPGARIEIVVKEETDENGDPIYSAVITRDRLVPRNQIL